VNPKVKNTRCEKSIGAGIKGRSKIQEKGI
jgi:hypothetical protein